jgi:hypothetical protein
MFGHSQCRGGPSNQTVIPPEEKPKESRFLPGLPFFSGAHVREFEETKETSFGFSVFEGLPGRGSGNQAWSLAYFRTGPNNYKEFVFLDEGVDEDTALILLRRMSDLVRKEHKMVPVEGSCQRIHRGGSRVYYGKPDLSLE